MSASQRTVSNEGVLKFLTYNIDGLNPAALSYRTNTILSFIISEQPDIVQLQEVVADTAPVIIKSLLRNGYTSFHESDRASNLCHYFTLSFARTDRISNAVVRRMPYSGAAKSMQGRDILQLTLDFMNVPWMFINCHLESCGVAFKSPGSATRQAQLREGLELIRSHSSMGPAILAGDLNIRDPEATKVMADYTSTIIDAAERVEKGRKSNTWFMPAPSKYSARYDRVYSNNGSNLTPVEFKTIGGEDIIEGTGLDANGALPYNTASDHRGIVVVFKFTTPEGSDVSATLTTTATHASTTSTAAVHKESTSTLNTASNNKRSRAHIPSHAEVITLDDSDTDDDANHTHNAPHKRTKSNNFPSEGSFNPVETFLNVINSLNSGQVKAESTYNNGHQNLSAASAVVTEQKTLTVQERRALFLEAVEKRNKGI